MLPLSNKQIHAQPQPLGEFSFLFSVLVVFLQEITQGLNIFDLLVWGESEDPEYCLAWRPWVVVV